MRGRLPETGLAPALLQGLTAIITEESSSTSSAMNIGEEEASFQEHIRTIDDQVRRLLSESSSKVALYTLTQHERSALLGIARIVQHDRRVLQGNLCRPPDQRDGECRRAPDWDSAYLAALVANWGEPVLLEADYYLLRSQSLFELGTSVEVKVLGPDHVKRYMSMALELTQKGYAVLQTALNQNEDMLGKYWRYLAMKTCIQRYQAANTIAEIRQHEAVVNLPASDELYENARHQVTQTLQSFYRGIQYYPSIFNSSDELSKDQEWSSMAELTESFSVLVDDFLARQVWIQNTIRLLKGAIQESKTRRDRQLLLISKAHLGLALWIYEQPDKPLLLVPRVSPLFQEMQCTALAALIYAKHAMENARQEDQSPEYYIQIIDSLYMMSIVSVAPQLIRLFSRKAALWIEELRSKFPYYRISRSHLHSADLTDSVDKAMHHITQRRREQRQ